MYTEADFISFSKEHRGTVQCVGRTLYCVSHSHFIKKKASKKHRTTRTNFTVYAVFNFGYTLYNVYFTPQMALLYFPNTSVDEKTTE